SHRAPRLLRGGRREVGREPPKLEPSSLPEESPVEPGPVRGKRQLGAHVFPTEASRGPWTPTQRPRRPVVGRQERGPGTRQVVHATHVEDLCLSC
uniref:Uncharacterized protein n=1 Tax=Tetraodon nigroviridis TaxID=99883 RepID=H3C3T3_TETNG